MTTSDWIWNEDLAPDVSSYFPLAMWRTIDAQSRYSPGGIVARMLGHSSDPLFVLVTGNLIVALSTTASARSTIAAALSAGASTVLPFLPGPKDGASYPVTSAGVAVAVSVIENGQELPAGDVRRGVLSPALPMFTASSLVNRLGDLAADPEWLVSLDQFTGSVTYHEMTAGAAPALMGALQTSGAAVLAAVNIQP